jgi:glucose-1-phosphate cytidylyltransferase
LQGDRFFLTYGDGLSDIKIHDLLDFHLAHGRLATITAVKPDYYQYGVMEAAEDGLVSHYVQYPSLPYWINGGFMIFEREALRYMTDGDGLALETGALQELIADQQLIMYRHNGFWRSMDTLKDAIDLQRIWESGAPWKVWDD